MEAFSLKWWLKQHADASLLKARYNPFMKEELERYKHWDRVKEYIQHRIEIKFKNRKS